MPNQNTPENEKRSDTPHTESFGETHNTPETPEVPSGTSGVPEGALNKALMRTFRGDITSNLGKKAKPAIDHFVPKDAPPQRRDEEGNPVAPPKKRNDAVVHTFKDDVQNLVRNEQVSLARIAARESDTQNRPQNTATQSGPWKTAVVIMLSVLFLVIGGVLAFGAYYAYTLNTQPNLTPQFAPSIIFTEARESIDVTDENARGVMELLGVARRNIFFSLGSVVELHLVEFVETPDGDVPVHLDAIDFLEAIEADVPQTFLQTLGTEYVLGIHAIDENVPFMILTSRSYGHTFAGMLAWEQYLEENFIPFMSPGADYVKPAIAEDDNAFTDSVIENLDVRLIRDESGDIRLLYAFVDRSTVVVTTNIRTLLELASRLRIAEI